MVELFYTSTVTPQHMTELAYIVITISTIFFYFVTVIGPPILKTSILGKFYSKLPSVDQKIWSNRLASNINAIIMLICMVYQTFLGNFMELSKNPQRTDLETRGELWYVLPLTGIFQGYLIYDVVFLIYYRNTKIWELGMIIHHAISTFMGITLSYYRAGIFYYAFLGWVECSTPFINNHWFLSKAEMQDSPFFIMNALVAYITFFFCRVLLLPYLLNHWYSHFWLMGEAYQLPLFLMLLIGIFLSVLSCLNVYWFYLMSCRFYERLYVKPKKD